MLLNDIIRSAFSKHNTMPRTSIIFAVCFLAGFMALNVYSFTQNNKRIQLIENISRENIPEQIAVVQQNVSTLDMILHNHDINDQERKESFINALNTFKSSLLDLQNAIAPYLQSTVATQNFVSIYGIIDGIEELYDTTGLNDTHNTQQVIKHVHNTSQHFYAIDKIIAKSHKHEIERIANELRTQESHALAISITFVVVGSLMIVFLLVDLFRRGELLERATHADRLKNSFFAMMSHEIRTPINGILGTLSLLQDTQLNEQQKHLSDIAHSSAESLLVIVNDVLDYSKIEAGKLELEYSNFNIKALLDSAFELTRPLAEEKKLQLSYHLHGIDEEDFNSDPARIRQIILNFLTNAIKFTDHGSITLNVARETLNVSGINTPFIRFSVVDTGIGIDSEAKSRLFREFSQVDGSHTRRFAGTGLGLAICRRLADMMHGHIGVESEVGKGSTFWFSVPLKLATSPIHEKDTVAMLDDTSKPAKLLVVEDNPTNQMIAESFLKQGGHHITLANNGVEAVNAVKAQDFDVVFMDIAMPEMDGFAATKAIRAMRGKYAHLPIIAMTAHAMRGDREECLAAGMNDYIGKPLAKTAMLQLVTKWAHNTSTDTKK